MSEIPVAESPNFEPYGNSTEWLSNGVFTVFGLAQTSTELETNFYEHLVCEGYGEVLRDEVENNYDNLYEAITTGFRTHLQSGQHVVLPDEEILSQAVSVIDRMQEVLQRGDSVILNGQFRLDYALDSALKQEERHLNDGGIRRIKAHPKYGSTVILPYLAGEKTVTHPAVQSYIDRLSRNLLGNDVLMTRVSETEKMSAKIQGRDERDVYGMIARRVAQLDELAGVGQ